STAFIAAWTEDGNDGRETDRVASVRQAHAELLNLSGERSSPLVRPLPVSARYLSPRSPPPFPRTGQRKGRRDATIARIHPPALAAWPSGTRRCASLAFREPVGPERFASAHVVAPVTAAGHPDR